MNKTFYRLVMAVLFLSGITRAAENKTNWPETKSADANWLYLERNTDQLPVDDDAAYQKINLPHTWNALDALETKDYRKAASWYRKNLEITEAQQKQRLYLRFGAAGQQARVYLNGEELTRHMGGYSAFTCELTGKVHVGQNRVDVWVSNQDQKYLIPLSGDFNFYGGLYRSVQLITAPDVSISRRHFGGPGYRVWSEKVSDESADLNVVVQVDNGSAKSVAITVSVRVLDRADQIVSSGTAPICEISPWRTEPIALTLPPVTTPRLWSPENPELYRVEIELSCDGRVLDVAYINHGFRWFRFTADAGFFLNGKPYQLKGVNRHQDFYREGNAVPLQRHLDDVRLMKEAGVNWLRMAHYQQSDYLLQLCDEMGLLVWEEIPYVNKGNVEDIEPVARSMMKDLIEQHFNHPAIILWGMGNEVWMGDRGDGKAQNYDFIARLNDMIHREDPVRKTVFVQSDRNSASDLKVTGIPDVFGYNLYRGWYGKPGYESLTERLNELHRMDPDRPLILSEFGADADTSVHTETPRKQDFSLEYQNDFLASYLDQTAKLDWLCGVNWWCFADFGAAHRDGSIPHMNLKGLVTFDRQRKKDAFFIIKSRWSTEPVLYLESPFWTERSGEPEKTYRVFTNFPEVELFHNGKSLGRQTEGFHWKVRLVEGENALLAKGTSGVVRQEHGFDVQYEKIGYEYLVTATAAEAGHPAIYLVDGDPQTR